jgi:hypothetical protein
MAIMHASGFGLDDLGGDPAPAPVVNSRAPAPAPAPSVHDEQGEDDYDDGIPTLEAKPEEQARGAAREGGKKEEVEEEDYEQEEYEDEDFEA